MKNQGLIEIVLNSLLVGEKIDFIIFDAGVPVTYAEIQKRKNYNDFLWKGLQKNENPSDHVPSRVAINFETVKARIKNMII